MILVLISFISSSLHAQMYEIYVTHDNVKFHDYWFYHDEIVMKDHVYGLYYTFYFSGSGPNYYDIWRDIARFVRADPPVNIKVTFYIDQYGNNIIYSVDPW